MQCRKRCNHNRNDQKVSQPRSQGPFSKQRNDPRNEVESFLFLMITSLMIWYNRFTVIVNGVAGVGRQADQSQYTSFQYYIFEKWDDFQERQNWPFS